MALNPNPKVIAEQLEDDGSIPNHARWPLLIYQAAFKVEPGLPDEIEQLYQLNGWGGTWRWGVYDYDHYHSNTHEALACFSGQAELLLGGESGITVTLKAGDAVLLPAGTGHKNMASSSDFQVVGAYPAGRTPDMNVGKPDERPQVIHAITNVPKPERDPFYGSEGPLIDHWKSS